AAATTTMVFYQPPSAPAQESLALPWQGLLFICLGRCWRPRASVDRTQIRSSSQLLRVLDDVAVRVGDVQRPLSPRPGHWPAKQPHTEPQHPVRLGIHVIDQKADLPARRRAALATDQLRQPRPLEQRELRVVEVELEVSVALHPHREADQVAIKYHRPLQR